MSELFIILILVVSFFPSMFTLFVLGGALHAFAIVLYDYAREAIIYFRNARDEQRHHPATGH